MAEFKHVTHYQKNISDFLFDFADIELWDAQAEIAKAVVEPGSMVSVASGHGLGKSLFAGGTAVWHARCFRGSRTITTAPTWEGVKTILWSEIAVIWERIKAKGKLSISGWELLQTQLRYGNNWWAVGVSTDNAAAFQGRHNANLMVIYDEASDIEYELFNAGMSMTSAQENRVLMIGNPLRSGGPFHHTHTGKIPGFKRFKISAFDSPNIIKLPDGTYVDKDPLPYPAMTSMKWIQMKIATDGLDSNEVRTRVFGEFPDVSDNQLIPNSDITAALVKGRLIRKVAERTLVGERILTSAEVQEMKRSRFIGEVTEVGYGG